MNMFAYTKGTVGVASYALENVSNDLAEKGVHGVKVICCWSMTDFPAAPTPTPTAHGGVSVILAGSADPACHLQLS